MTPLQELHDRVEAGDDWPSLYGGSPESQNHYKLIVKALGSDSWEVVERVTKSYRGSLDAAKAMHDGDKGWVIQSLVQRHGGVWVAHIWEVDSEGWHQDGMRKIEVWNECPARALLLGRLRALIEQAQGNG